MANEQGIDFHGVATKVPAEWQNFSVYKFAPQLSEASQLKAGLRVAAKQSQSLSPTILITREGMAPPEALPHAFEGPNENALRQNRSFKVLKSGAGRLGQERVVWQDTTQFVPSVQLQVFQRQLAMINPQSEIVLVTLTGTMNAIEEMAKTIGFSGS